MSMLEARSATLPALKYLDVLSMYILSTIFMYIKRSECLHSQLNESGVCMHSQYSIDVFCQNDPPPESFLFMFHA
jgi:hypothetical protein